MDTPPANHPCKACFEPHVAVIEETFSNDDEAFERFARLLRLGKSPTVCQKGDGALSVCHHQCTRNHRNV